MGDMDDLVGRREFLKAMAGCLCALAAPPAVDIDSFIARMTGDHWFKDILPVITDYRQNILVFGIGALLSTETYPYLESVKPEDIWIIPTDRAEPEGKPEWAYLPGLRQKLVTTWFHYGNPDRMPMNCLLEELLPVPDGHVTTLRTHVPDRDG